MARLLDALQPESWSEHPAFVRAVLPRKGDRMSSPQLEAFLARLYTDETARARFLQDSEGECRKAGLGSDETDALCRIDRAGLLMAAESFAHKRKKHRQVRVSLRGCFPAWLRKLRRK